MKLWHKQEEVLQKLMTPPYRVNVRSGHNVGKTFLIACIASWMYDSFDPSKTIATAPTKDSVRDLLFAELRKLRPNDPKLLPSDTRLFDHSHHWVHGFTASKDSAFQGRHETNVCLLYDEAIGIPPAYWVAGRSMFTGAPGSYWVATYNPTDTGAQIYEEESVGDGHLVVISQFDHPNIAAELRGEDPPYPSAVRLSQVIRDMDTYGDRIKPGEPYRKGEVSLSKDLRWMPGPLADCRILGRWPGTAGDNVWSDGLWQEVDRTKHDINPLWHVQIGCDVANFGFDETTIWVKQGPCILHAEYHNGWGPKKTCERLKELCHQFAGRRLNERGLTVPVAPEDVPCLIDNGGGWASGIFDWAGAFNFVPILSVSPAVNEDKYHNTRTELWFNAREHAEQTLNGQSLIDVSRIPQIEREKLKRELLAPSYTMDSVDRFRVEPKPETCNKIGRSPDRADGFNLAHYRFGQFARVTR